MAIRRIDSLGYQLGLLNRLYDRCLQDALKGQTKEQQTATLTTLFGSDAIRGAAIMAENGAAGFDKMATAIGKVSASDVAKTRMDNLQGSIQQLQGSVETLAISIGQAIIPVLTQMANGLTDAFNWFQSLDPVVQGTSGGFVAAAGGALLLFGPVV